MGSPRVRGSGHPLTRDVPQLQAHQRPAVPVEDLESEVHPDGGPVMLGEELVDVALDDAGLAHAKFADDQHLEEVLAGLGHRGGGRPPARVLVSAAAMNAPAALGKLGLRAGVPARTRPPRGALGAPAGRRNFPEAGRPPRRAAAAPDRSQDPEPAATRSPRGAGKGPGAGLAREAGVRRPG